MSLSIGIVGLPNVGKSTLFNALSKRQAALAANYPFATIEPNIGVVDVPDERLEHLAQFVRNDYGNKAGDREVPEKITPTVIKFYDIAGLVKGASQGEGLGNEFLGHIREVDAIVQVVRDFSDENVIKAGAVSPEEDIQTINTELILADSQSLEKRIERMGNSFRFPKVKEDVQKAQVYAKLRQVFNNGSFAKNPSWSEDDRQVLKELNLLTLKPMIYVLNVDEQKLKTNSTQTDIVFKYDAISISAKVESELSDFPKEEQKAFMQDLGISESGLDKVIKKSYEILDLQSFLTMGPKEVRAWTIKKGAPAPQAAGVIHTDFERGFISAEVINYRTLLPIESLKKARELGKIRLEGKEYIMQDGDVVEFRFSV
jgi:GTP-binding protein YchF